MNQELPDVQVGFRKGREPEIKLPTFTGSQRNEKNSRKTSTSVSLTMLKPKALKEMGIPDHLTYLLRNLYVGQQATVKTLYRITDWFRNEKGVQQVCLLSPHLFNLYAEHFMRNARLHELQA